MALPTEPIGSIPRPAALQEGLVQFAVGAIGPEQLTELQDAALVDTITRFEQTGSPVLADGEQSKPSYVSYPIAGLTTLGPGGAVIPFADGHIRQLPVLAAGPFRYQVHAASYLARARQLTTRPVKQAVIAPSALSLLYPPGGLAGYSREQFTADLVNESETDIRRCLDGGAAAVQLDFTEGRLSLKLDPSGDLLQHFIDLNNQVLDRFSDTERQLIGVHTCPGGDRDSAHSLDVDYAGLLPRLFSLRAGNFYLQLASEARPRQVLDIVREHVRADQRIFVGVTDPADPVLETPEQIRDRILTAAEYIPANRLGSCDDCGFSPFADDTSTSRDLAFAKISARVEGTELAASTLGI